MTLRYRHFVDVDALAVNEAGRYFGRPAIGRSGCWFSGSSAGSSSCLTASATSETFASTR